MAGADSGAPVSFDLANSQVLGVGHQNGHPPCRGAAWIGREPHCNLESQSVGWVESAGTTSTGGHILYCGGRSWRAPVAVVVAGAGRLGAAGRHHKRVAP